MANFAAGPTRVVFEIDQTNPNTRRAIITSTATNSTFETRGPVPLPAALANILNNPTTSAAERQKIERLFSLWSHSGRAQLCGWHVQHRVPAAYQEMAYEAIGKTMFRRDGAVLQAQTYNCITNMPSNARDLLLARLLPLFRTTTDHQDVVVCCTELENALVGFNVTVNSKWGVYLTTHQSRLPQMRVGDGLPLQQLDAVLARHRVLKHSAWAFAGGQVRHTVPTNLRSAPAFAGPPGLCPFLLGPT